jgi:hypothetical protein
MAQQNASVAIPQVPDGPTDGNPASVSEPAQPAGPTQDGYPVTPAVARSRQGAAAAHGHGGEGQGNN